MSISCTKRSAPDAGCELRPKDLHRDAPAMLEILREIDLRHAASTDLALEAVARAQCIGNGA
jgi:hypothetical protein